MQARRTQAVTLDVPFLVPLLAVPHFEELVIGRAPHLPVQREQSIDGPLVARPVAAHLQAHRVEHGDETVGAAQVHDGSTLADGRNALLRLQLVARLHGLAVPDAHHAARRAGPYVDLLGAAQAGHHAHRRHAVLVALELLHKFHVRLLEHVQVAVVQNRPHVRERGNEAHHVLVLGDLQLLHALALAVEHKHHPHAAHPQGVATAAHGKDLLVGRDLPALLEQLLPVLQVNHHFLRLVRPLVLGRPRDVGPRLQLDVALHLHPRDGGQAVNNLHKGRARVGLLVPAVHNELAVLRRRVVGDGGAEAVDDRFAHLEVVSPPRVVLGERRQACLQLPAANPKAVHVSLLGVGLVGYDFGREPVNVELATRQANSNEAGEAKVRNDRVDLG
mmetsp:Transcript_49210/g.123707  ORF Transcript_49210/g.123707 Transcript_49210/m.123707 type:complete len:389 (-) Transcript_49210:2396-3562(-)